MRHVDDALNPPALTLAEHEKWLAAASDLLMRRALEKGLTVAGVDVMLRAAGELRAAAVAIARDRERK